MELPVDFDSVAVHPPVPGFGFSLQRLEVGDSSLAQTLAGKQADLDFRLIQPTAVRGSVVDRKARPDLAPELFSV